MEIQTLPMADIELPPDFEGLRGLAYDLWWTWSASAARLFAWIDPEHWRRYHNPVQLLINVEPHRWQRLAADADFRRHYDSVMQALAAYRSRPCWFEQHSERLNGPIAYFSMEFGLHESLGIYSGGLGALAGDHCKSASDLGLPLVGVGLLYQSGTSARPSMPTAISSTSIPTTTSRGCRCCRCAHPRADCSPCRSISQVASYTRRSGRCRSDACRC
jgi:hypothetical protein